MDILTKRKTDPNVLGESKKNKTEISHTYNIQMVGEIDENLYSRQLYVLGSDAMKKMSKTNVIITGLDGLGVEIAKNIILGGLNTITLHDSRLCEYRDLSTNYYVTENDIGKNISEVVYNKLLPLNEYVTVKVYTGDLTQSVFNGVHILVIVNKLLKEQLSLSSLAEACGLKVIICNTFGLSGCIFNDFGRSFTLFDSNGEQPPVARIERISNDEYGYVTCLEEYRHNLEDGDHVIFKEVEGMSELNNSAPFKIKVITPFSFSIGDMSQYSSHGYGGYATCVKVPKEIKFKSLKDSIFDPEFFCCDFAKFDRQNIIHACYLAASDFFDNFSTLPSPHCLNDFQKLLQFVSNLSSKFNFTLNEDALKIIKTFSFQCSGSLAPIQSIIGGIAAQEVFKAATGKFSPIKQYMYFDAFECLPELFLDMPTECFKQTCSRYDGQITVFGKEFQEKLSSLSTFVVGAGAIGCEHLKNLTMMGVGEKNKASIFVTDMDTIQKSNLNRQFLFRNRDIGSFKSTCACQAVSQMNPKVSLKPLLHRVGPETENIFDVNFFDGVRVIMNALDNVDARIYMDGRSVEYGLPLIESGTLGTKGNVQVVIPKLTETYSSSYDPPEKSYPMCTVKNFPYDVEHTIQWSRDLFEGLFMHWPTLISNYIKDPKTIEQNDGSIDPAKFQIISEVYSLSKVTFIDCIKWAKEIAYKNFVNDILQLVHNFPADKVTLHGHLFWSGTKRFPHAHEFASMNESVWNYYTLFIVSASKLRALNINIPCSLSDEEILTCANSITLGAFKPKDDVKIATTDAEMESQIKNESDVQITDSSKQDYHQKFTKFVKDNKLLFNDIIFEKDDDSNHHIDFILAASNLRSLNYRISEADRLKVKLVAGNIVPAIATTTAVISGLACIELYKIVQGFKDIERYRNSFINLALPFFGFSDPIKCKVEEFGNIKFTLWDYILFDPNKYEGGECSLSAFIDVIQKEHNVELDMLSYGTSVLYGTYFDMRKRSERLDQTITQIIEVVTKKPINYESRYLTLIATCSETDDDPEDMPVPSIRYILPNKISNGLNRNHYEFSRHFHGYPGNVEKIDKDVDTRKILKKVLPYLWPNDRKDLRSKFILTVILLIFAKVSIVLTPYFFKIIVDKLTQMKLLNDLKAKDVLLYTVLAFIAGYGGGRLCAALFNELKNAIFSRISQGSIREISNESFRHVQNLDLDFHLSRKTGLISKSIDRGTRGISFILTALAFNIVPTTLEIGMVTTLMGLNFGASFAATTFGCVSTYALFTYFITKWRTKYRVVMNQADNECGSKSFDTFINHETVKYFNNEKFEQNEYDKILAKYEEASRKTITSLSLLNFGQSAIFTCGMVGLMVLAANGITLDLMTVGDIVMLNSLLFQLSVPMNFLGSTYRDIRQSLVDLQSLFDILQKETKITDNSSIQLVWPTQIKKGESLIVFENVSFSYQNHQVFKNLSFSVPYGHKVAIVGGSGSGKSTIVRLLYRFYDPTDGDIYINGQNIKNVTLQSLRKCISVVPQDQVLFHNTIYYNIKYGNISATDDEVYRASKIAGLHPSILKFPHMYDTMVGERGLKLSGGEKQRVAIARSILKSSPIFIYDEATSSLDSITEKKIMSAISKVLVDKTCIVIAHRLSTIVDADEIIVLQNGNIADRGTHLNLLINKPLGHYSQLWNKQHEIPDPPIKRENGIQSQLVDDFEESESRCSKAGCCSK